MIVETPRLLLHPLEPVLLSALVAQDWAAADGLTPYPVDSTTFAGDAHVLALRAAQVAAAPLQVPWLLRAAVSKESSRVIGKIGFHAAPDAAGTVEVGYRVAEERRRQGLAREMTIGMLRWAAGRGATRCLASVRPDNAPSLRLIDRLGFLRVGEQVDEIDGLEGVFCRELTGALPTYEKAR